MITVPLTTRPPHVERMVEEHIELADRIAKLRAFMGEGDIYDRMESLDRRLLRAQARAMETYQLVLELRLWRAGVPI